MFYFASTSTPVAARGTRRAAAIFLAMLITLAATASASITVSVSPAAPTVPALTSKQFTATVSGTTNTNVTWLVNGVAGGSSSTGTISSSGVYTAPPCPASSSVTISALSQYDGATKGSTTVYLAYTASNYHYVTTHGSDSATGTGCHPWLTIQHAANVVNPGDVVVVGDGTYSNASATGTGSKLVSMSRGGTSTAKVLFKAEHIWKAVLDGLSNTTEEGWTFASTANYVRVQGFEIKGFRASGMSNWGGGTNLEIAQNNIHDIGRFCTDTTNGRVGIFIHAGPMLVERNLIHDIGRYSPGENGCSPSTTYYQNNDHGTYISTANNVTLRDNIFYHNIHGWSVHVYSTSVSNLLVAGNTFAFANPWRPGYILINIPQIASSRIDDNVFYQPNSAGIYRKSSGTPTGDSLAIYNNISNNKIAELYNGSSTNYNPSVAGWSYSANKNGTDPLLVNASAYNFHLATGSPAINAGVTLTEMPVDYNGVKRASPPSMGAYEYLSTP